MFVGLVIAGCLPVTWTAAHDIEKQLFLIVEKDEVIASNTMLGRFDQLKLKAREKMLDHRASGAVAVVVTNRRFAAYGVLHGAWNSRRTQAEEQVLSLEVADFSATLVTNQRILNFSGRRGAWSEISR